MNGLAILSLVAIGVLAGSGMLAGLTYAQTGHVFDFSKSSLVTHACGLTVISGYSYPDQNVTKIHSGGPTGPPTPIGIPNLAIHSSGASYVWITDTNGHVSLDGCYDGETVTFTYQNTEYGAKLKPDTTVTVLV